MAEPFPKPPNYRLDARRVFNDFARLTYVNGVTGFTTVAYGGASKAGTKLALDDPPMEFYRYSSPTTLKKWAKENLVGVYHPIGVGCVLFPSERRVNRLICAPEQIVFCIGAYDFMEMVARARGYGRAPEPEGLDL